MKAIAADSEDEAGAPPRQPSNDEIDTSSTSGAQAVDGEPSPELATSAASPVTLRTGTKIADVINMLSRPDGATIDALVRATDWLPHTTRAALTGLRKRGCAIERSRTDAGHSVYRLTQPRQQGL